LKASRRVLEDWLHSAHLNSLRLLVQDVRGCLAEETYRAARRASMPRIMRASVVLPLPDWPTMVNISGRAGLEKANIVHCGMR
jgi:hypothetical protein